MQHKTFVELHHMRCSINDTYRMECGHHTLGAWSENNSIRYLFVVLMYVHSYLSLVFVTCYTLHPL